jgi:hypothetical protein
MVAHSDETTADQSSSASTTSEKDNSTNEGGNSSGFDNELMDMSKYPHQERIWLELLVERPEETTDTH